MQVERTDEVFVIKCGATNSSPRQLYRLHIGHRGDSSCAAYLISHLVQPCAGTLSLELIGDGPTRTLGRASQRTLLAKGVYFQHNAVGSHRQVFPLRVPIVDEVHDFLQGTHLAHALANLESPLAGILQILEMAFGG